MSGWVYVRAYRPGVGAVAGAIKVEEAPAGHEGKWLTPAGVDKRFRVERKGRTAHATRRAALADEGRSV